MTLRHMKIFVTVFQQGSITGAARDLHLAQPSVSLAIKELENYYGLRLFERIGRHISPTEGGKEFYGYAVHIVSLFQEMEKKMKNWDAVGSIRIGTSITIGTHILPALTRRFQREYPKLHLEAIISKSSDIEQHILNNSIDIGLIETQPEHPELTFTPFMEDTMCAIVPCHHPLTRQTDVSLSQLADASGLSSGRFSHLFREETGMTPLAYVKKERLETARSMLVYTDHPISEISAALCFSSESHFIQAFREYTGKTPGRYRKSQD